MIFLRLYTFHFAFLHFSNIWNRKASSLFLLKVEDTLLFIFAYTFLDCVLCGCVALCFKKGTKKLLYYFSFQLKISSKEIREYNNDMCRVSSIQYFVFGYFFSSLALILYHFITYAHLCFLLFVTKRSKFYDFLRNFALCTLTYMIIIIFVIILIMLIIYNKKNFSTFYQI